MLELMVLWILGCIYLFELVFSFASEKYPEIKLLNHTVILLTIFWGNSIIFSQWLYQFISPPEVHEGYLFSTSFPTLVFFYYLFDYSHSEKYEVISWFWFEFPWWLIMLNIFSCVCWPSVFLPWKRIYSESLPIL